MFACALKATRNMIERQPFHPHHQKNKSDSLPIIEKTRAHRVATVVIWFLYSARSSNSDT